MTQQMDPSDIGRVKAPLQIDPKSPYLKGFNQQDWSELSSLRNEGRLGDIDLLGKVGKVASANPKLRAYLDPILKAAAAEVKEEIDAFRLAHVVYPKIITHRKWASMTNPERHVLMKKLAHKPILQGQGLNKSTVRADEAFMLYFLDASKNSSKFYEGIITEEDGGFRVIRRWGRMTDSGQTGRIDGGKFDNDPRFWKSTMTAAKVILNKKYMDKTRKGYVDAFGTQHRTPDGHKLPMGQYPVGLGAGPFGWGGQSVKQCIPALRGLEDALTQARLEIQQTGSSEAIEDHLVQATRILKDVAHADSTMAAKLKGNIGKVLRRVSGSPRFLPDPDGRRLAKDLFTIINYVRKQLSHC